MDALFVSFNANKTGSVCTKYWVTFANHCCCGKGVRITYSVCISTAFGNQHSKSMRRIILSSVARLAVPYFSTLRHKRHDFRKKCVELKKCVVIFCATFEKFLILRIIQRDTITKAQVYKDSYKVPLFLSYFNEPQIFSKDFRKIFRYQISGKSVRWEPGCSMRPDGRTGGPDEVYSRFSVFCDHELLKHPVNYVLSVVSLTNTSFCPHSVTNVSYNFRKRNLSFFPPPFKLH